MHAAPPPTDLACPVSSQALRQVADQLAWPLLVLRLDGQLLHANLAARRMLRRRAPLRLARRSQVVPAAAAQRAEFSAALDALRHAGAPRVLRWPSDDGVGMAVLTPLDHTGGTTVALLAMAPNAASSADTQGWAEAHRLTPAETRVLHALARGASAVHIAAAVGVAPATVRSQMASLRRKTGHRDVTALQRALVALVPLAPPQRGE